MFPTTIYERELTFGAQKPSEAETTPETTWRVCVTKQTTTPSSTLTTYIVTVHFHAHQSRITRYACFAEAAQYADQQYEHQKAKVLRQPNLVILTERAEKSGEAQDSAEMLGEDAQVCPRSSHSGGEEFTVLLCYLYARIEDPEALAAWFTGKRWVLLGLARVVCVKLVV